MKKLVIVDDEAGIIDEVRDFFTEEGYDVHTADTGKDGIECIERVQPDVVLLDIKLPDMSGLDVLRWVKAKFPAIRVIVNTGYVDQAIIDDAAVLGRDAFLQKPFDLEVLKDEIDRLMPPQPQKDA